ncbi:MAG: hypothetical protein NC131_11575 [Roseburia sp.]|nr:hypothetical protein [Roseburia sp.]
MRKKLFDLQLFTDGGDGGTGTDAGTAGGTGDGGQKTIAGGTGAGTGGTYSYAQAEEIANARADRAEKAALASYFKQQGMSEAEITAAISDYKEKKAKNQPDVAAIEKQRDDALKKVAEMENMDYLRSKGVKQDDLDYVLFKVSKNVNDKTDFKKAADAYLKENPRYTGRGYTVVSTGTPDGGSGAGQNANDIINSSIRAAFGRG